MTRLSPATPRGLDPLRRVSDATAKRRFGRPLEPSGVIGHHRPLLAGYSAFALAGERYAKAVDPQLKNLAMLRTAQLIGCEWCLDFGSHLARETGAPEAKLRQLSDWRDSDAFEPLERLVLEYADAITRTPVDVGDELFERLRTEFDERQLVELTLAITAENLHARTNWAFGIESQGFAEGAYCVPPAARPKSIAEPVTAR